MRREILFVLATSCCLALATPAWADEALADSLFQEGQAAMKREDFGAACVAFAASHKADPAPGTLINLGICNEKQGKYASAWSAYSGARELAAQKGQADRASAAKTEVERLLPKVQKVKITIVGTYDRLIVRRDGESVPVDALAFPLVIDAGKHHLDVAANGKKARAIDFEIKDLAAGGQPVERLEVPALEDAEIARSADPVAAGPGEPQAGDGKGRRTMGLVAAGAGLAAVAGAVVAFAIAADEDETAKGFAPRLDGTCAESASAGQCSSGFSSHDEAASSGRLLGIVAGGAGVALLGVGAYLFFTAPRAQALARARVVPAVSPTYAGAALDLAF